MLLSAITALASAAAASYAGYATMAPTAQFYGRTITHGTDPNQMALTYDDGPNHPHTLHLLDVLAKYQARATFFLIGRYVRQRPELVRAIAGAGHEIGNHTFTHPNLIFAPATKLRQELEDCNKVLEDALGTRPILFRPPFGGRRPSVLRAARALGMEPVMWSVTAYDWNAKSSDAIFQKASNQIDSRRTMQSEVILLHDGGHLAFGAGRQFTVQASEKLLQHYAGKRFVGISDLIGAKSSTPEKRD